MNKILFFLFLSTSLLGQVKIAQVKYQGGGDWYANPTSLKNLIEFCNNNISSNIDPKYDIVDLESDDIFYYPFLHITGHGNIVLSDNQIKNLRTYLSQGGFLHIDDNYGMYQYVMRELERLYPDKKLIKLSKSHKIFYQTFSFSNGLPKIHKHDDKAPEAYAISIENRVVLLYTYETDLSDGWEDQNIHNNPEELREQALRMGANIIEYAFTN